MLPGPRRYGADLESPHPGGHSTLGSSVACAADFCDGWLSQYRQNRSERSGMSDELSGGEPTNYGADSDEFRHPAQARPVVDGGL